VRQRRLFLRSKKPKESLHKAKAQYKIVLGRYFGLIYPLPPSIFAVQKEAAFRDS
jgi:hypothetical protein